MVINCLVVDDEKPAREILATYIGKLPSLRLVNTCADTLSAFQLMQNEHIDLIFLDIQMPELTGIQWLHSITNPPKIIFTTAYSDYAVEGFNLGIVDYLLKPFSFERFLKAVSRVNALDNEPLSQDFNPSSLTTPKSTYKTSLFLKSDKVIHRVAVSDILFLTSMGNYTKVYSVGQMLIIHNSLTGFEALLNPEAFIRVHKSYIVAIDKIKRMEGNRIFIQEHEIPIGEAFKRDIQLRFS